MIRTVFPKVSSLPNADKRQTGVGVLYNSSPTMSNGTNFVPLDRATQSMRIDANSVDQTWFIAPAAIEILSIQEIHSAAGAGSSTLDVKKVTGTTAPASGTTILAAVIALDATINTVQTPTLTATAANLKLAVGDRIALDFTGTLTGLVGAITVHYRYI